MHGSWAGVVVDWSLEAMPMNSLKVTRWSGAAIAAAVVLSAGLARAHDTGEHSSASQGDCKSSCAKCTQGSQEGAQRSGQGMNSESAASQPAEFGVKGEVASVSAPQGLLVVIVPELGRSLNLQVNSHSQVYVGGDRVSLASIPPGAQVKATYVLQGNQLVVKRVNALVQDNQQMMSPIPEQGTNASRWNSSVNQPGRSARESLKNSDVDDRDLPGESLNVTHSTDYGSGG